VLPPVPASVLSRRSATIKRRLSGQIFISPYSLAGAAAALALDDDGRVLGTVQLVLDMPQNGQHRAEIAKLMVAPDAAAWYCAQLNAVG
jgi:hypothetical protein